VAEARSYQHPKSSITFTYKRLTNTSDKHLLSRVLLHYLNFVLDSRWGGGCGFLCWFYLEWKSIIYANHNHNNNHPLLHHSHYYTWLANPTVVVQAHVASLEGFKAKVHEEATTLTIRSKATRIIFKLIYSQVKGLHL